MVRFGYHKIIECIVLEGISRIIKIEPLHCRQGHKPPHLILDQAAQVTIQPGLEYLQGRSIHNLYGQPVPAPHRSLGKELPLTSSLDLPYLSFKDQFP